MSETPTFTRIGAAPQGRPELGPWPWNPRDVPLSAGMTPQGRTYLEKGRMVSGVWTCNAGSVEIGEHPVDEVCFVVSGTVTLTDATGRTGRFGAGECFAIPRGFKGTWSQSDGFAKFFVAVDNGAR